MSIMPERIESAFCDELARIEHEGVHALLGQRGDALLYALYRRGYIRGHSDHAREVREDEERDRRAGRYPQDVNIRYEGDRLILDGKDRTPARAQP